MIKLGVNVDHVATLRQARRVSYPDPLEAALAAIAAGADAITVHLREDRRHILDHDLFRLRARIKARLNQELAPLDDMVDLALRLRPHEVCLVPEKREEITTEGGLDVVGQAHRLAPMIERFKSLKIGVSLFIDPESQQIETAARLGAHFVELHTGAYANLAECDLEASPDSRAINEATLAELAKIREGVKFARSLRLKPNAGHGLNYRNVGPIAAIAGIQWLHIGHAIIARAVMVGMARAVREMKVAIARAATGSAQPRLATARR